MHASQPLFQAGPPWSERRVWGTRRQSKAFLSLPERDTPETPRAQHASGKEHTITTRPLCATVSGSLAVRGVAASNALPDPGGGRGVPAAATPLIKTPPPHQREGEKSTTRSANVAAKCEDGKTVLRLTRLPNFGKTIDLSASTPGPPGPRGPPGKNQLAKTRGGPAGERPHHRGT